MLKNNLIDIVNNNFHAQNKWCMVIGDLMLDQYIIGQVDRISPEAPVPVLKKNKQINRIGGAGNVALNLLGLGIKPILIGQIGNDEYGAKLTELLKENTISTKYIFKKKGITTTKTRVMSGHQQIMRIDDEATIEPTKKDFDKIIALINQNPNAIIISDYEKGLLNLNILKKIIQTAKKKKIPVLVDPKGKDLEKYRGVTAITPNKKEAALLTNSNNVSESSLENNLKKARKQFDFDFIAMTQGELGIKYITNTKTVVIPTSASKQVFDVSGAGDTVIATLAAGIIFNMNIPDALKLANIAAGIVIEKIGTMPIKRNELLNVLKQQNYGQKNKIFSKNELLQKVNNLKLEKLKIGFTNGCFDILHTGHVIYLEQAKSRVDFLILALNTDSSVKKIKGSKRPVINEVDRARVLCALESVDAVVLFDEPTPLNLIKLIKPDVLIKGNDYTIKNVVGSKEIKQWGGKVMLVPVVQGKSTTKIIEKLN